MSTRPVALVAHPSADVYGSDLQLVESITALEAAGWEPVLTVPEVGPLTELVSCRVEIRPTPVLRKAMLRPFSLVRLALRAPIDLARLVRYLRRTRPGALYVNTVTIPLWIVAARLARVPVLVHVHEAERDASRLLRTALNAPLLLAGRVVANSRASAEVAAGAVPRVRRRLTVIVNGIPDRGPTPLQDAQPDTVALVARLSPRKGVDVALEAVARLRRSGRDVRLTICGTSFAGYEWYEDQLRARAAEPDLVGAVTFAGYVNPTLPVLARAAVVLVPSRVEPFGNTAVEALLAGRPLIASDVQGLAEIVAHERTGLLVPAGDPDALAAAITRVLDDPVDAERRARAGRSDAQDRFGVDAYRVRIADAVAAVAGRATPSAQSPMARKDRAR